MKKHSLLAIFLMVTIIFSGCKKAYTSVDLTASVEKHAVETVALDEKFYEDQLGFSLKLFQKAAKQSAENILISPLSVATALSMAANGADGKTAEELLSLLGGVSLKHQNDRLYTWRRSLDSKADVQYRDANSIWLRDLAEFKINEEFLQENRSYYDAQIFKSKFDRSTVDDINRWAKEQTNEMIPKFLDELNVDGVAVLLNAIAFDAKWEKEYETVREQSFTTLDGKQQTAKMMCSTESVYLENESATGFLRRYNDQYSFGALLPKEKEGFEQYLQALTAEELGSLISDQQYVSVDTAMPKFKNEYNLGLNEILIEMGMPSAFDENQADFTKMTSFPVYISNVLHCTAIEVDEQGTKASALTGVMMNGASSAPTEKKQVILNRPFLYFILDTNTNLPIFIGTVTSLE